jgi:hypothetical protein
MRCVLWLEAEPHSQCYIRVSKRKRVDVTITNLWSAKAVRGSIALYQIFWSLFIIFATVTVYMHRSLSHPASKQKRARMRRVITRNQMFWISRFECPTF